MAASRGRRWRAESYSPRCPSRPGRCAPPSPRPGTPNAGITVIRREERLMSMQSTPPHESPHAVPPTRHQPRHGSAPKHAAGPAVGGARGGRRPRLGRRGRNDAAHGGTRAGLVGAGPAVSGPAEAAPVPDPPLPTAAAGPTGAEQVFEGTGDDVVRLDQPVNLGVVRFECPRCTRTTTVVSDAGIDTYAVQHLSGGPYSGRRWFGVRGDTPTQFEVTARSVATDRRRCRPGASGRRDDDGHGNRGRRRPHADGVAHRGADAHR